MEVKYVKSSPFLYLNRIHIATFLPFRAYNTDNQLIIDSIYKDKDVKIYVPSQSYDLYTQYTSYKVDACQPDNWALYRDKIIAYDFD